MKLEPGHKGTVALREYVQAVAGLLGVEATACWSEQAHPATAYIALAETSREHPGRLLMAQWTSDTGWCLALEPDGVEAPVVIAQWPRPRSPRPAVVARRIRLLLNAGALSAVDGRGGRRRSRG